MSGKVTTIVMTRDRRAELEWSLPRHGDPVILVDNGSLDDTVAWTRQHYPEIRIIRLSKNQGAVARNHGVRAATTPYVAFADDDSYWEDCALARAAELLDLHPRLGVVAGRVLVGEDGALDPRCAALAASPLPRTEELATMPSVLDFVACGAVMRREAFQQAGGFDPVVRFGGEEERLALDIAAAGWELVYTDYVTAHHRPSLRRPRPIRREALEQRNELLTAVMRRPWPVVASLAGEKLRGRAGRRGLVGAAFRMPRALAHRHVVEPAREQGRTDLD